MWSIAVSLLMCTLGQAPEPPAADPRVQSIAPFVDSGVIAVLHLDLTRGDFPAIMARLSAGRTPGASADASKALLAWHDSLRRAGAKELFVVINACDMPGLPVVVVPLTQGTDAAEIGRLFCGGGKAPPPIPFPTCASLHNAVMAGTAAALDRVRDVSPQPRPELAAAFAALDDGSIGLRLLVIPSADTRRVLEETVPSLPRELGGGPITQLTRGILWAAIGLNAGPKPSFKLVVASPGEEVARSLQHLGQSLSAAYERSPEVLGIMPDFAKLRRQVKTEIVADRIVVTGDAQVAAEMIDSALRPARQAALRTQCVNNEKQIALAVHNYISRHGNAFPPAYTTDKAGQPLLSWRVLILPFLDQEQALFKEFHLDEPWDSPHNRTLISKMPEVYRCSTQNAGTAREGKTRYIAPRAPGTIFRGAEPVKLKEIIDGTSNTIMFFDGGDERAVIWTKPDDWDVPPDAKLDPSGILVAHGEQPRKGTNVAFADGSVRFFRETIMSAVFRALLSYAAGEVISSDDY
jgi:prepilin-type processing-associated H-X9-DG protein